MLRAVVTGLIVAAVAAGVGYRWYQQESVLRAQQDQRITELTTQVGQAREKISQLQMALEKVQDEERQLNAENQALTKTIAQSRLTGKPPAVPLPYPPK